MAEWKKSSSSSSSTDDDDEIDTQPLGHRQHDQRHRHHQRHRLSLDHGRGSAGAGKAADAKISDLSLLAAELQATIVGPTKKVVSSRMEVDPRVEVGPRAEVGPKIEVGPRMDAGSRMEVGFRAEVGSTAEVGSRTEVGSWTEVGSRTEVDSRTEVGSRTEEGSRAEEAVQRGRVSSATAAWDVGPGSELRHEHAAIRETCMLGRREAPAAAAAAWRRARSEDDLLAATAAGRGGSARKAWPHFRAGAAAAAAASTDAGREAAGGRHFLSSGRASMGGDDPAVYAPFLNFQKEALLQNRDASAGDGAGGQGLGADLACEASKHKRRATDIARDVKTRLGFLRRKHDGQLSATPTAGHGETFLGRLTRASRPSAEEVRSWSESFDNVLSHKHGVRLFHAFLRSEFSEENLEFWLACREHQRLGSASRRSAHARKIYGEFVATQAPREVNLDAMTRATVSERLRVAPASPGAFRPAQARIRGLMEGDSYPRFLRSAAYAQLSATAAPRHPPPVPPPAPAPAPHARR